jgi:hypothetical protein
MPKTSIFLLSLTTIAIGCGPGYLDAGEKVPATDVNKQLFDVLKAYHQAVEGKDVGALKRLVSPKYHSNGGTTERTDDDFGIDKLDTHLPKLRDNVKKVQLRMKLIDMQVDGNEATVDYEFVGRVLLTEGGIDSYKTWNEFNRMKLEREGSRWLIVGGL